MATTNSSTPRTVRLIRVAVLLATGFAITFTPAQHEQLAFDMVITAIGLALIAVAHLIHAYVDRGKGGAAAALSLGVVALAAAVAIALINTSGEGSSMGYALVVAAWALISALLEFLSSVMRPGARQDTIIVGGAGMLLALFTLLARQDPVAVLGFFGAYAVISGVFLGISAFDNRSAAAVSPVLQDTNSPS